MCKLAWLTEWDFDAYVATKQKTIDCRLKSWDACEIREAAAMVNDLLLCVQSLGQERMFFQLRKKYAAALEESMLEATPPRA